MAADLNSAAAAEQAKIVPLATNTTRARLPANAQTRTAAVKSQHARSRSRRAADFLLDAVRRNGLQILESDITRNVDLLVTSFSRLPRAGSEMAAGS